MTLIKGCKDEIGMKCDVLVIRQWDRSSSTEYGKRIGCATGKTISISERKRPISPLSFLAQKRQFFGIGFNERGE
ncbi:MAG: hypothetical protein IIC50_24680 [Planctomycetes bacterium]|nr:hypothetical protein [Planctomycetota bacterium]